MYISMYVMYNTFHILIMYTPQPQQQPQQKTHDQHNGKLHYRLRHKDKQQKQNAKAFNKILMKSFEVYTQTPQFNTFSAAALNVQQ